MRNEMMLGRVDEKLKVKLWAWGLSFKTLDGEKIKSLVHFEMFPAVDFTHSLDKALLTY